MSSEDSDDEELIEAVKGLATVDLKSDWTESSFSTLQSFPLGILASLTHS